MLVLHVRIAVRQQSVAPNMGIELAKIPQNYLLLGQVGG
jgi:hypothetical protein